MSAGVGASLSVPSARAGAACPCTSHVTGPCAMRSFRTFACLLASCFALLAAGCSSVDEPRCVSNAECARGFCVAGQCVENPPDAGGDADATRPTDTDEDPGADGGDTGPDAPNDAQEDPAPDGDVGPDTDAASDADAEIDGDGGDTDDPTCVEPNPCGGCDPLEEAPGATCGPCDLDQLVCDGPNAVRCSGSTPCVNPAVTLETPEVLSATQVGLTGRIRSFGVGASDAEAHGFCWSSTGSATAGATGATCEDLGATGALDEFGFDVTELLPGTTYRIRAFLTAGGITAYSPELTALTFPAAPPGVSASRGTSVDHVALEWTGSQGADNYIVFRDGEPIGETSSTEFLDEDADPASGAAGPIVQATEGERVDGVLVRWQAPAAAQGTTHVYVVVAANASGESEPSPEATGYRGGQMASSWRVLRDGNVLVASTADTEWTDDEAPLAGLDGGAVVASNGENASFVALFVRESGVAPPSPSLYEVIGLDAEGTPMDMAGTATGYRAAGPITYEWERSPGDANSGPWTVLGTTTTPTYEDTTAPAPPSPSVSGEGRYYRVRLRADGAEPAVSDADRGYRANQGPPVTTLPPDQITQTQARIRGGFTENGTRPITDRGFCWGPSPNPAPTTGTCQAFGPAAGFGEFTFLLSGLTAGQTVHVRAWAEDSSGLAWGASVSFPTLPAAPTGLTASDGEFSDFVRLRWNASTGATQYDVLRDGTLVATVTSLTYDDASAPAGALPHGDAFGLTASQGTFSARVLLEWNPNVAGTAGPSTPWSVRARNASGTSAPATDTGFRAAPTISDFRIQIAGNPTVTVPASAGGSWNDLTAPPGALTLGPVTASEGESPAYIEVGIKGWETTPGPSRSYRIAAMSGGTEGVASASATGFRGTGPVSFQWERSGTGVVEVWDPLPVTLATFKDPGGAVFPWTSLYRVTATATGVPDPVTDVSNAGYRSQPTIVQIGSGAAHTCALFDDGSVRCWGSNQYGQLGVNSTQDVGTTLAQMPPVAVPLEAGAVQIAVGLFHTCALMERGKLTCWGRNTNGQLGTGDLLHVGTATNPMPIRPISFPSGFTPLLVTAGSDFTCAGGVRSNQNEVYCWGNTASWRLGDSAGSTGANRLAPSVRVDGLPTNSQLQGLASGRAHTCAVQSGRVRCWGDNNNAQLYRGGTAGGADIAGPSFAIGALTQVHQIRAGGDVTCVLRGTPASATCWGQNHRGQLGIFTVTGGSFGGNLTVTVPSIPLEDDPTVTGIETSGLHTCVLTTRSTYCFGANDAGQLARGNSTDYGLPRSSGTIESNLLARPVTHASTGAAHSCFHGGENRVECYGVHTQGRLGNGATNNIGTRPEHIPATLTPVID